ELRLLPVHGAVGRDLDLGDLAVAAPGESADALISRLYHHRARRRGDDRIGLHPELELSGFSVGLELRIARSLPTGHPGLVAELQPSQPLYVEVALEARHNQPHGKAVRGSQGLAVLAVGNKGFAQNLVGEGNAAGNGRSIAAFRKHPV